MYSVKKRISFLLLLIILLSTSGCTKFQSSIKDLKAETFGIARTFNVYDDFGNQTMTVSGKSTDMQPSEVENVILITIDGYSWQHVGSSMIAVENGLENLVETYELSQAIDTSKEGNGGFTSLDRSINNFKSEFSGLKRVIVVKNQSGVIIAVYEGDNVLVEKSGLPSSTKILIDNKRMTIYRCDFEIFEAEMIQ
ncbi:DUF5052 family protein [Fusibacter ferrireducens]|uniref:DUF5052 family protein n=1 Tax=Fusibacter ferrireducens TaxID=2785058 RepID=A0ABR9ZSY7_9FIRM|nr:DUF5052 family protein [Fusibacter ferrireducens]MBF4693569.1 DUF5052 family protein [Fusibacter ferrireducens]